MARKISRLTEYVQVPAFLLLDREAEITLLKDKIIFLERQLERFQSFQSFQSQEACKESSHENVY